MTNISIQFLGAASTVTGSKFYIQTPEHTLLIDCGMFQGLKSLREENWKPLPVEVSAIDTILLTHGHLDHTGYIPRLVQQGFQGTIYGTAPTLAVTKIILEDSAKIHEEEAEKASQEKYSKHQPALPFYTRSDVEKSLTFFKAVETDFWKPITKHIRVRFCYNGHIIGSTYIEIELYGKRFVFSGDIGRVNDSLLYSPQKPKRADYLFLESTYGNRLHPQEDSTAILSKIINQVIQERGTLIIPSFAVERMQTLMFLLWNLYEQNKIPNIPIFVDSPMGTNVLSVFEQFSDWHRLSPQSFRRMKKRFYITQSYADTWKTIDNPRPKIVMAGSGMLTGGRVLTYLQHYIDKSTTRILMVGYQAEGTRGRQLLEGAHELKIYGKYYPVKAQIHHLESLSAHADQRGILDWLENITNNVKDVFLIHGEPTAQDMLRVKIRDRFGWRVSIPKLYEKKTIRVSD